MEVLQGQYDLSSIEACSKFILDLLILCEFLFSPEQSKKLATWTVVHDHVEFVWCLERTMHLDDELVVNVNHNVPFCLDVFHLFFLLNVFFLHDLHC